MAVSAYPGFLIQKNPTISTSAYVANNSVGGIQELVDAAIPVGGNLNASLLTNLSVVDASAQGAALDFLFFRDNPAGGTYTDHGAVTVNAADLPLLLGKVSVATTDYVTFGGIKVATVACTGLQLKANSAGKVYVVTVTTGTPTYAALALTFNYGILRGS